MDPVCSQHDGGLPWALLSPLICLDGVAHIIFGSVGTIPSGAQRNLRPHVAPLFA